MNSEDSRTNIAFVLGASRSGTTWLAKIIDSHPEVVYRHEPDILDLNADLPVFCPPDQVEQYLAPARRCVRRYVQTQHVRATGVLPNFPKAYLSRTQLLLRATMISLLRGAEAAPPIRRLVYAVPVPDFTRVLGGPYPCLIKSVGCLGRVNLLARAEPNAKVVIIIRHPCGYVASRLRQPGANQHWKRVGMGLPNAEQARRRGLTRQAIERMSLVQRLAWVWTIFNEKAMEDAATQPNAQVLRYEDLCAAPVEVAKDLFEFIGLRWHPQTEAFVSQSASHKGGNKYYSIYRESNLEIGKWRNELLPDQVQTIREATRESAPGRLFPED